MKQSKEQNNGTRAKAKDHSIKDFLKSPIQVVFILFALLTLSLLVPWTKACMNFISHSQKNKPSGYEFP